MSVELIRLPEYDECVSSILKRFIGVADPLSTHPLPSFKLK